MAITANQLAPLGLFDGIIESPGVIRCEQVAESSPFVFWVDMIEVERGRAFPVAADLARAAHHLNEPDFPCYSLRLDDSFVLFVAAVKFSLPSFWAGIPFFVVLAHIAKFARLAITDVATVVNLELPERFFLQAFRASPAIWPVCHNLQFTADTAISTSAHNHAHA